jgi:hypothetical protein
LNLQASRRGHHPRFSYFDRSENRHRKLWRYTDFPKFVSLLQKSALHFARCDKVTDPFEGKDSRSLVLEIKTRLAHPDWVALQPCSPIKYQETLRKTRFINCWHLSAYESAALWAIYSATENAVAIQTTPVRIRKAFAPQLLSWIG